MEATKYYNPNTKQESFFLNEQQAKNEGYTQLAGASASSGTLTSEMFKGTPSANFQTPNYSPVYPVASLDLSEPEKKAQSLYDKAQELNKNLVGESAYRTAQEEAHGLTELQKTNKDLMAKLNTIKAEAAAIPLQLQQDATGRGITKGGLAPIEAGALRTNAIQALTTGALLQANQGNIATALDLIDRAVKQKYDPIREERDVAIGNLNLILESPEYTKAQKDRAQIQLDIQETKKREEEEAELNEREIGEIAIDAAKNGADALTLQKIQNATDAVEAQRIAFETGFITEEKASKIYGSASSGYFTIDSEGNAVAVNPPAGGVGTGGTGKAGKPIFTQAQKNKGASKAGVMLGDFDLLEPDVQNYYVQSSVKELSAMDEAFANVKSGKEDPDDVKNEIDNSNIPFAVKEYLKGKIDEATPTPDTGTGGFWDKIKSFFGF